MQRQLGLPVASTAPLARITDRFTAGVHRFAGDHDGRSYPWIVKTTGMVNHFYFYCVDGDFGPFFVKFCSYFPYNAKLWFKGNHWAAPRE